MGVSIIIPTIKDIKSSGGSIILTIRSILDQSSQPDRIIVVSPENNTDTIEALKSRFERSISIVTYPSEIHNISYARNLGVKSSDSEKLFFLDDDVVLGSYNTLEKTNRALDSFDFCCGASRMWTPMNWGEYIKEIFPIEHIRRILKSVSFSPISVNRSSAQNARSYHNYTYIGNYGAIKRAVFDTVGGFDENYIGWIAQDTDLMMRLCYEQYSYHILSNDGIFVFHLSHPVDKESFKARNRELLKEKMNSLGIRFNSGNFFGDFSPFTQDYSVIQKNG